MSRNLTYDQWLPYKRYEKHECDIKLKDGTIIKHVYPNAGKFSVVCDHAPPWVSLSPKFVAIDEKDVAEIMYVRYYQNDLCKGNCNE
jgi:hypothetical protein